MSCLSVCMLGFANFCTDYYASGITTPICLQGLVCFLDPKNGLFDPKNLVKESKQHINQAKFDLFSAYDEKSTFLIFFKQFSLFSTMWRHAQACVRWSKYTTDGFQQNMVKLKARELQKVMVCK